MAENGEIILRDANIQDLAILQYWDTQPHVIASGADAEEDWSWEYELPRSLPWRDQLIAELDGRPIGSIQIIDPAAEETQYWGEVPTNLRAMDIWIGEKEDLGKGYGTIMMKLALARCFEDKNVTAVLIDPLASNKDAIRFYERIGFEFVEQRQFDDSDCYVYALSREKWEANL